MAAHLTDTTFLNLLDKAKIKTQYIKIIILNIKEEPIKEIQGIVNSGTLNIKGSSSVRRTISFSMNTTDNFTKITNINNLISINKKIKVEVGYKNHFKKYHDYGEIVWFKCGTFVIEKASVNQSTQGFNISISGKDKMALLDGSMGGTLPASVTFHEKYEIDKDGLITVFYPTIYEIIYESVTQFGKEHPNNVFINDLEETAKLLVRYNGDKMIWFPSEDNHNYFIISNTSPGDNWKGYKYGDDIGYMETPMTYPGELVKKAGSTVTQLLDDIIKTLGNVYEYYYDVDGHFIFQKIKDYQNTSYTKLGELNGEDYIKHFSDSKYYYSLTDKETVISLAINPQYNNIKNDFVVWGNRTTSDNQKVGIRYHLAIDNKPILDRCNKYMYAYWNSDEPIPNSSKKGRITRIEYYNTEVEEIENEKIKTEIIDWRSSTPYKNLETGWYFIGTPCKEWREELYRQAFEANIYGIIAHDYHEELLAEWRELYDTTKWKGGWNPQVNDDPTSINYWLEFIDSTGKLGEYSISSIGKRSKVLENDKISTIFNLSVPDVIFVENNFSKDEEALEDFISEQKNKNQDFCLYLPYQKDFFTASSTGTSAFEAIRELLYQHLIYNISINITCFPKFYLEPNNLIYIQDLETGIIGEFVIKDLNLPLGYSGSMTIAANEALTRI